MPLIRAGHDRRHPHQLFVAVLLIVAGLPLLLGRHIGPLLSLMPRPLVFAWAATFVLGGAAIIGAALVRSVMTALYIELVVDLPIALTGLTYAIAVSVVSPGRALQVWLLYGALTAAFAVRWWQARRTVRLVRRTLREVAAR